MHAHYEHPYSYIYIHTYLLYVHMYLCAYKIVSEDPFLMDTMHVVLTLNNQKNSNIRVIYSINILSPTAWCPYHCTCDTASCTVKAALVALTSLCAPNRPWGRRSVYFFVCYIFENSMSHYVHALAFKHMCT